MSLELTGPDFDYLCLPSVGASGGVIIAWRRDCWVASQPCLRKFSATVRLHPVQGDDSESWWLTLVYGPTTSHLKPLLLQELLDLQNTCAGAWVVCGDFNLILHARDKNNGRLEINCVSDGRIPAPVPPPLSAGHVAQKTIKRPVAWLRSCLD